MFYRCSDASTSTSDWLSLAVNAVPQALLARLNDFGEPTLTEIETAGIEVPSWHSDPEWDEERCGITLFYAPDPGDYGSDNDANDARYQEDLDARYQEDLAAWRTYDAVAREEIESRESRELLPLWGTMWIVEDHETIREAAAAEGLRLYEHEDVPGLILGADSGGHSFYSAYWIPLRARLIASNEYNIDDRRALLDLLAAEGAREAGPSREEIAKILGVLPA